LREAKYISVDNISHSILPFKATSDDIFFLLHL
jgi:hypothetical protein